MAYRSVQLELFPDMNLKKEQHSHNYSQKWRQKHPKYQKEYRCIHKEHINELKRLWTKKHPEYRRKYYRTHRDSEIANQAKYRRSVRSKILLQLGNKCSICGWNELPCVLQIHHVYGAGHKEMKRFGGRKDYLRHVLRELDCGSRKYRLLCPMHNRKANYLRKLRTKKMSQTDEPQRRQIRQEIIDLLGGKCVRCEEKGYQVLDITHRRDNGAEERKNFGHGNTTYYRSILGKIMDGSIDYEVLCVNCHAVKDYDKEKEKVCFFA